MFQALLTGYYLCNAAAAVTLQDYASVARCIATSDPAEARFLGEEERAGASGDAIGGPAGRRFAGRQEDKVTLVAGLRAGDEAQIVAVIAGF